MTVPLGHSETTSLGLSGDKWQADTCAAAKAQNARHKARKTQSTLLTARSSRHSNRIEVLNIDCHRDPVDFGRNSVCCGAKGLVVAFQFLEV